MYILLWWHTSLQNTSMKKRSVLVVFFWGIVSCQSICVYIYCMYINMFIYFDVLYIVAFFFGALYIYIKGVFKRIFCPIGVYYHLCISTLYIRIYICIYMYMCVYVCMCMCVCIVYPTSVLLVYRRGAWGCTNLWSFSFNITLCVWELCENIYVYVYIYVYIPDSRKKQKIVFSLSFVRVSFLEWNGVQLLRF